MWRVLSGGNFITTDGVLTFPNDVSEVEGGGYAIERHVFGPYYYNSSVIYANTNHNLSLAIQRLLGHREADRNLDTWLREMQEEYFAHDLRPFLEQRSSSFITIFPEDDDQFDGILDYFDMPHPKKHLRVQSFIKQWLAGTLSLPVPDKKRKGEMKLKLHEPAKNNKKPRAIVDLGVDASMRGFVVTQCLKLAEGSSTQVYECDGRRILMYFVKSASHENLRRAFSLIINPSTDYVMVYFSDDSMLALQRFGKLEWYNMDIKSCDASHTPSVFAAYAEQYPKKWRGAVLELIDQCSWPLKVYDVTDRRNCVVLQPTTPRLYSGSTITTGINNLAKFAIGISILLYAHLGLSVQACANIAGYLVDLERVDRPCDLQFLKNSPVFCNGVWEPFMNLGVYYRSVGQLKSPLPGSGEIRGRAEHQLALFNTCFFGRDVIEGLKARTLTLTPRDLLHLNPVFEYKWVADYPRHISLADYLQRYNLSGCAVAHLTDCMNEQAPFVGYGSSFVDTVLSRDYGLNQ